MLIEHRPLVKLIIKFLKFPIKLLLVLVPPRSRLFLSGPDTFVRYKHTSLELKKLLHNSSLKNVKILDVGGGDGIFKRLFGRKLNISILDVNIHTKSYRTVIGTGCCMPFKDNSFDVVLSIATFQYIPKKDRSKFISELRRVSKKGVILYSPVDSASRIEKDIHKFRRKIGLEDKWLEDEIKTGLPSISKIKKDLPNTRYYGLQNQKVWYYVMLIESIPIFNLIFPGIVYGLLNIFDSRPPSLAYIFTWEKQKGSKLQKK